MNKKQAVLLTFFLTPLLCFVFCVFSFAQEGAETEVAGEATVVFKAEKADEEGDSRRLWTDEEFAARGGGAMNETAPAREEAPAEGAAPDSGETAAPGAGSGAEGETGAESLITGEATVTFKAEKAEKEEKSDKETRLPGTAAAINVRGDVLVKKAGSALWEKLEEGALLGRGDMVETRDSSSAILEMGDGSYLRLAPMSSLKLMAAASDNQVVDLIEIKNGKAWGRLGRDELDNPVVLKVAGGYVDGKKSTFFVESDEKSGQSCVDLLRGDMNARSAGFSDQPVSLKMNTRAQVAGDRPVGAPKKLEQAPEENDTGHSCMAASESKQPTAKGTTTQPSAFVSSVTTTTTTEDGQEFVEVVVFASMEFKSEKASDVELSDDDKPLVFNTRDNTEKTKTSTEVTAEETTYEVIEVEVTAAVDFRMPEAAAAAPVETPAATTTETPVETAAAPTETAVETVTETPAVEEEPGDCVITEAVIAAVSPSGLEVSGSAVETPECGEAVISLAPKEVTCENAEYDKWAIVFNGGAAAQMSPGDAAQVTLAEEGTFSFKMYAMNTAEGEQYSEFESTGLTFARSPGQPEVTVTQVGNVPVEDVSEKIVLYSDTLEGGYLYIRGEAASPSECEITKARVSLDGGMTWQDATVSGGSWEYRVSPSETTYYIKAEASDEEDTVSEEMFQAIEAQYYHMRPEDNLREIFEKLIQAYLNKDEMGFMDLTKSTFYSQYEGLEDRSLLGRSLESKFRANQTIYLKYKIDTVLIAGEQGRVGFGWSASASEAGYPYYGTFIFEQGSEWRFLTVEDPDTFLRYTSEVSSVSLSAGKTTLSASPTDTTTITATVRDSAGNLIKDGTEIRFSATFGSVDSSGTTRSGVVTVTYTTATVPTGQPSATATVTATGGDNVSASVTLTVQPGRAPLPPGME